jgi:hypothetical protein
MNLRWLRARRVVLASLALTAMACGGQTAPASRATTVQPKIAYARSAADLTPARHWHSPTLAGPQEATRLSPANASVRKLRASVKMI